ncbi:MAG TPA: hypothetical protein VER08_12380 [Pyrinomonadaceae bacterium]|nr:hypothetical protein [Pyrinomonadaceae bacterium]
MHRLFGAWKLPDELRAELEREGVLALDEGVRGSATYRNFRAPWRYSKWRREWYTASVVVTRVRLLALRRSLRIVNVPFDDARFRGLQFSLEAPDRLLVAFDASLFQDNWSGTIEYRFRTNQAQKILDVLRGRVA